VTFPGPKTLGSSDWSSNYTARIGGITDFQKLEHWLERRLRLKCSQPVALLLRGPTGSGKSLLVRKVVEKFGLSIAEFGPGYLDTEEDMKSHFRPALMSPGFRKRVVVVDGIEHIKCFTQLVAMLDLLKGQEAQKKRKRNAVPPQASNPLIMIGDDQYDKKFAMLSKYCVTITLFPATPNVMRQIMLSILRAEKISIPDSLGDLISSSEGNIRFMINQAEFSFRGLSKALSCLQTRMDDSSVYNNLFNVAESVLRGKYDQCTVDKAYEVHDKLLIPMMFENYCSTGCSMEEAASAAEDLSALDFMDLNSLPNSLGSQMIYSGFSGLGQEMPKRQRLSYPTRRAPANRLPEILSLVSLMKQQTRLDTICTVWAFRRTGISLGYITSGSEGAPAGDSPFFSIIYPDGGSFNYGNYHGLTATEMKTMHKILFMTAEKILL
jgi:DNA polymerase III delta prime subunit